MSLIDQIIQLKDTHSLLKHEQLVHGVIQSIDKGVLQRGDKLPSINAMVRELGYARKTIVHAYEELKDRGLVESKKLKGYYIISDETNVTLRIALLLYAFYHFHQEFYNTFRQDLGKRFHIDVFFHHNNVDMFKTILSNINGKYGKYVVAPIPDRSLIPILEGIPPEKLLIVDRYLPMPKEYSYISQEFEQNTYRRLVELSDQIGKYNKMILFFDPSSESPREIVQAFNRFIKEFGIDGTVKKKFSPGSLVKGHLYFCASDTFLWKLLRDCHNNGLRAGRDIGVLSRDDHIVKEIVLGGITTISTDFNCMAKMAASCIKQGAPRQTILETNLIRRGSV
ncbi:MAG TPA: GntR family transcriptional regulator [Eudoraea sp.]|nr:GntR family transcriptional regulator [Eudoraea sp.]